MIDKPDFRGIWRTCSRTELLLLLRLCWSFQNTYKNIFCWSFWNTTFVIGALVYSNIMFFVLWHFFLGTIDFRWNFWPFSFVFFEKVLMIVKGKRGDWWIDCNLIGSFTGHHWVSIHLSISSIEPHGCLVGAFPLEIWSILGISIRNFKNSKIWLLKLQSDCYFLLLLMFRIWILKN